MEGSQKNTVRSFGEYFSEEEKLSTPIVLKEGDYSLPESGYDKEIKARKKVNKALLWITTQKGFFAQLLSKLNIYGSSDPRYQTMCTNGFNIQYHPDFVLGQSDAAVRFVLCHEVLHCVGEHMSRRMKRDPLLWNYACDYAINPILNAEVQGNTFEWPKNPDGSRMGLYEEKYEGMKAEDIYDLLINDAEQQKKAKKEDSPDGAIHVIDSDEDLGEPDPESIVQEVPQDDEEGEEGGEENGKPKGPGSSGKQTDKPGQGPGGESPGEGEGEGEGEGSGTLVGKRVRITAGPDAGKIGTVKQVLANGDIIVE